MPFVVKHDAVYTREDLDHLEPEVGVRISFSREADVSLTRAFRVRACGVRSR